MNDEHEYITWTKSKIETIIINETYTGKIAWNRRSGKRNPGKKLIPEYSPYDKKMQIIDTDLYNNVKELRKRKSNLKDSTYYTTPFLLKKKLICGICGAMLTPRNYGVNKTTVYKCPTKVGTKSELIIKQKDTDAEVIQQLKMILKNSNTDELWSYYGIEIAKRKVEYKEVKKDLNNKIVGVKKLQNNVYKLLNKKDVSDDLIEKFNFQYEVLSKTSEQFSNKIISIDKQLKDINSLKKEHYDKALNYFKESIFAKDDFSLRVLIDILIEHIEVHKSDIDDSITLKILLNPLQGCITPSKITP